MRKSGRKRYLVIFLTWVLIYVLVLTVGILTAAYVTYNANENLANLAYNDAEYYVENGEFTPKTTYYNNAAFVFDPVTDEVDFRFKGNSDLYLEHARRMTVRIDEKGAAYHLFYNSSMDSKIILMVGVPMPEGGAYYFIVKSMHSLLNMLLVLFSSMSIFFVMGCVYSMLLERNNRKTENLRREYVANVSHELKSPIASILALSESLYDGVIADDEHRKKCLSLISKEAHGLEHTVMGMLELSRTQSMQISFEKRSIGVCELFLPIVEKFSVRCDEMGVAFTAPENADRLPPLFTNPERIAVLTNVLLDNALKFVSPGGHIALSAELRHKCVIVCVKDDGIGIDKSEQKRIFERFYTVDHARNMNGSGLGLAIAQEICYGLGEKLWVDSSPGKGAAFYFTVSCK